MADPVLPSPNLFPPPVLVPPGSEPTDPLQANYLQQVSSELSELEYGELRKAWLHYQQCQTDIEGFFKKIKLMLRGSRWV